MLQIHESTIHIIFGTCVVLMEAMHTGKALVGIYLIRMRLMFHKTYPGPYTTLTSQRKIRCD